MEKAMVCLSFDDGRSDNLVVYRDILVPKQIPVTFNITTGYIDGSCPLELLPSNKTPLSVKEVQRLAQNPLVEIALHGDQHQNTELDIVSGREKLIDWLNLQNSCALGLASPNSGMPVEYYVNSDSLLFTKYISYLRTGLRIKNRRFLRIMCRKIGRIIHIPLLYQIAYYDTLMDSCKDRVVYSVPVMKDTTYRQVKAVVDLAIRRKNAVILMFHSILEDTYGEDNWSWELSDFEKLCKYLCEKSQEDVLDIVTTQQLVEKLSNSES